MYDIRDGINRIDKTLKIFEPSLEDNHYTMWSDFERKKDSVSSFKVHLTCLMLEYVPEFSNDDHSKDQEEEQYFCNMGVLFREIISIMKDYEKGNYGIIIDYSILGNRIAVMMDTTYKTDLKVVIDLCGKLRSLNDILNWRARKKNYVTGKLNEAISFDECWVSKIDDIDARYGSFFGGHTGVVFSGKCLDNAERYLKYSNNDLITDRIFLNNLPEDYKSLFDMERVEENKEELGRGKVKNIMFNNELMR